MTKRILRHTSWFLFWFLFFYVFVIHAGDVVDGAVSFIDWASSHWKWITGAAGSLLLLYGGYTYVVEIKGGGAKPHLWTWAVFFTGIAGGTYFTFIGGAGLTGTMANVTLAFVIGYIFRLSWKKEYRHEGLEKWYHPLAAALAVVIYGWQIWRQFSPLVAALAAVVADITAIQIQWEKSWNDPESEPILPWCWGTLGGALELISLAEFNLTSLTWPIYFVASNFGIVVILVWKKKIEPKLKAGADKAEKEIDTQEVGAS